MPWAGNFSYRAKGPAVFVFFRLDGLLTGLGPPATINSEPLSDLALQFRHPVDWRIGAPRRLSIWQPKRR
jgi:hypothetical protein